MYRNETEFEQYIRDLIEREITENDLSTYAMRSKKAVDIVISRENPTPALFFIEVKYHQNSHGRLGTGGSDGIGFQPEILRRCPAYFETNLRWVLSREGDYREGILFVPTEVILRYIAGGQVGSKHNNIQLRIFDNEPRLSEKEFVEALKSWLQN